MSFPSPTAHMNQTQRIVYNRYKEIARKVALAILRDRAARISLSIIAIFTFIAIFAPILAPYDPNASLTDDIGRPLAYMSPSLEHPMGTTHLGRDVLSQWIYGTRISLLVGAVAGGAVIIVGVPVGLVAGYYKGTVDLVVMRFVDILYGIPAVPLVLVIALFLGPSLWNVILAFVFILWRTMARVVRAQTLTISERPYVKAAKATGASDFRIMTRHILPNILPIVFIEATIITGVAIMLEAGLSFLGYGTAEAVSWGTMLQLTFATGAIRHAWWWVLPPGLSITILILAVYYLSRSFERVTNPELKGGIR